MLFGFIFFILFVLISLNIARIKSQNLKTILMSLFCFIILYFVTGPWALIYLGVIPLSYFTIARLNSYFSLVIYFLFFLILKIFFIKFKAAGYLTYEPDPFTLPLNHPINLFSLILTFFIFTEEGLKKITFREFFSISLLIPILGRPINKISDIKNDLLKSVSDYNLALDGIYFILLGLIKKFVLADRLMLMISNFFNGNYNHFLNTITLLIMPLYLYLEITSLFDISLGILKLLGISVEKNYNAPLTKLGISGTFKNLNISLSQWYETNLLKEISLSNIHFINELQWNLLNIIFIILAYPLYNNILFIFWFLFAWLLIELTMINLLKKIHLIYRAVSYLGFVYLSYLILSPNANFTKVLKEKIGLKYGYDQIPYIPKDVVLAFLLTVLIVSLDHLDISFFKKNSSKWFLSGCFVILILFFYNENFRSFLFLMY